MWWSFIALIHITGLFSLFLTTNMHSLHMLTALNYFRRGVGGLPSSRLLKSRGSVAPGDDSSLPDESVVDGNEDEKWLAWVTSELVGLVHPLSTACWFHYPTATAAATWTSGVGPSTTTTGINTNNTTTTTTKRAVTAPSISLTSTQQRHPAAELRTNLYYY